MGLSNPRYDQGSYILEGCATRTDYLILVCTILEPTSTIIQKIFLSDHNLLHNTSNKGKIIPYNMTITPYRCETHIILSRPFLSLLLSWLLPFCVFLLLLVRFDNFIERTIWRTSIFTSFSLVYAYFPCWCFVLYSTYVFFK